VKQRLRDIGEARIVIDGVLRGSLKEETPASATTVPAASRKRASVLAWSLVGVLAVVSSLTFGGFLGGRNEADMPILRTSIVPPENVRLNLRGSHPGPVALSPDGKRVVYTGRGAGGSLLYVRELDAADAHPLPGTVDAGYPFWSPDGRSIGFFAGGKLKRVDVDGSPPLTLCDAPVGKGGSWNEDGTILFAPSFNTPIHRVAAAGGTSTAVTAFHGEADENSHRFPQFFPDGDHFIYFARVGGESSVAWVGSLSGGSEKEIMRVNSNAVYASGHLLFMRETTLMARPFDPDTQEFTGDPMPLADPVRVIPGAMRGIFDASENGMVVYQSGASVPGSQLVWRDLEGKELGRLGDVAQYEQPAISPDGKYVALDYYDNSSGSAGDIWVYDIARAVRSRFTFDPSSDGSAVWSPAGDRIVFASSRGGLGQLYVKNFGGASNEERLVETEGDAFPTQWVGDYLVYSQTDSSNTGDIWAIPVDGDRRPIAILNSTYGEYVGRVSPNGNWISYSSDESGKFEVYVTSFPASGRKWQVSTGGGNDARWDPLGRGIYYFAADNTFRLVEVEFDAKTFAVGRDRTLFESNSEIAYDITSDGKRLLILEDADEGSVSPITLLTNWPRELELRRKR
jgi:Tol biopolymer transport system component